MNIDSIANTIRSRWVTLLAMLVMLGSGFYLYLFVSVGLHVGYVGVEENLKYWLLFPYDDTYTVALVADLLFIACGFTVIFGLTKSRQTIRKNVFVAVWIITGLIGIVFFCGFMLLLSTIGGVARLDSTSYDRYIYHLAYKDNFEYGFTYYLVKCDTETYQCEFIDSFFPHGLILSDSDALLSRFNIVKREKLTVVYQNQVIYERPLP